jgi:MOSC domain-containing protein YiiM
LEGDRYFTGKGSFQKPGEILNPSQEASLIEIEAVEGLQRECGIAITPAESRRNILTRGIRLNDLVGREFTVGAVRMKGIKLCRPCDHLEALTKPGVKVGLHNRGGLRAQILNEGVIRVSDAVTPAVDAKAEAVACA